VVTLVGLEAVCYHSALAFQGVKASPGAFPRALVFTTGREVAREDDPMLDSLREATASPPRVAPWDVVTTMSHEGSRGMEGSALGTLGSLGPFPLALALGPMPPS